MNDCKAGQAPAGTIDPPAGARRIPVKGGRGGRAVFPRPLPVFLFIAVLLSSCGSGPTPPETPLPTEVPAPSAPVPQQPAGGGVAEEIRSLTEMGTPSSLQAALEIISSRGLGSTEFGRAMVAVNVTLLKVLYPSVQARLPQPDPPVTHSYSRILKEAGAGVYTPPPPASSDFLEHVLPFLAYYPGMESVSPAPVRRAPVTPGAETPPSTVSGTAARPPAASVPPRPVQAGAYLSALPDLEKAALLNPGSVLVGYFIGMVYENSGRLDAAEAQYTRVWESFPECFPVAQSLARVMDAQGRRQEAVRFLQDLVIQFPDNLPVKRQLALAYYRTGDWSRAETAVAEILQNDPRDGESVLMRAHILVEQGQFIQAQAPLDMYASVNPANRLYLFLRARVQAEGYHNRDAALNYLRSILRGSPDSDYWPAASVYAARLLTASSRPEDQAEGRELLMRLLAAPSPPLEVAGLALEDAVRREDWEGARVYLDRLLGERRSAGDLLAAYTVERAQGNNAAALSYARELYGRDRTNEDGISAYISALIDTGRQDEASRMIESRLDGMAGGVLKSRYFYLRSRIRGSEELAMNDLRSSLFEDPRNLDALTAMFEIYHRRRDERRAVYYLKQALALAPENPRLKRYEANYAAALGSTAN